MAVELREETGTAAVFVAQVIVGTFIFSLVLAAAFGLSQLVAWMDRSGAPSWMINGAHWVEWSIFWLDIFCFGLFLTSEVLKFVVGLVKEWRT